MTAQLRKQQRRLENIAGVSLITLPLLLALAFLLHFSSLSDFFQFQFSKPDYSAEHFYQTLSASDGGFRLFTLPHLVGYLSLPLFIVSALAMAYACYRQAPKHALFGLLFTIVGTVFLAGVFSAWLSFAAINQTQGIDAQNLISVLGALTSMQGPLLLSTLLSALSFAGLIILAFGLYRVRSLPRWSIITYITGSFLILLFMDLDNWMLIGAIMQGIGIWPLSHQFMQHHPLQANSNLLPNEIG